MRCGRTIGVALILLGGAGPVPAAGEADGIWAVELLTTTGRCRPRYNSTIEIKNDLITGAGQGARGSYVLSGRVEPGGKLEWKSSGGDSGSFSAELTGDRVAKGQWSTSSGCGGTLTATRQ